MARAGGHGATEALGHAKGAMQIDFRKLNRVVISDDGKSATIGGGANVKKVVHELLKAGKQTGEFSSFMLLSQA